MQSDKPDALISPEAVCLSFPYPPLLSPPSSYSQLTTIPLLPIVQIADAYWWLHTQPRSAFTQEIDVRTYVEKW